MERIFGKFWGPSLLIPLAIAAVAVILVWLLPDRYDQEIESSALALAAVMMGWSAWQSRSAAYSIREQTQASNRMAQEMQESRLASLRPIIVMGRAPTYGKIKDARQISEQTTITDRTWLYNVGFGPAINLHFSLKEPNRKNPSGAFMGKDMTALGPGEAYEVMIENVFGQKRLCSHDLMVEYEDVFGGKWCSGLELNYTPGAGRFTVLKLFYEKMS